MLQDADTLCRVATCIVVARVLYKALSKVETETIDIVLLQPVLKDIVEVVYGLCICVVEVVEYAPVVGCIDIEEGVILSGLVYATIPPHLGVGELAGSVVEYHIDNYGDTTLVALVDKLLIRLIGTVCLIRSEVEAGVVAPRALYCTC